MKMNRPLRTEAEYEEAIGEVRRLWGAKADTPTGDRLDLLLVLVSAYEDEHFRIDPPDPIDAGLIWPTCSASAVGGFRRS
jgi:HTH-type transcriptional regulator/antitoxin HigA